MDAEHLKTFTLGSQRALESARLAQRRALAVYYQFVTRLYYRSTGAADVAAMLGSTRAEVKHILDNVTRPDQSVHPEFEWCCTFCNQFGSEVAVLHRGPGVAICQDCVEAAAHALEAADDDAFGWRWTDDCLDACDFCGRLGQPRSVAVMPAVSICEDCFRTLLN